MAKDVGQQEKKRILKDIILNLHKGLSPEAAKEKFEKEIGAVSPTEIAEIEQSLINEGLSPDEIKKFCNVHALIFQSALEKVACEVTAPSHPIYLFKLENREIEKITAQLKSETDKIGNSAIESVRQILKELLGKLKGINVHYERKEQVLFPYLEKKGFMGPSKVMWGKDNEVRGLLKTALTQFETVKNRETLDNFVTTQLKPLISEVEGMIFKEESILFPTSLEKLSSNDWVAILKESDEVGYVFIEKPRETEYLIRELKMALPEEPVVSGSSISFPTGSITVTELMALLNSLPLDITFVGSDDTVKYFSQGKNRVFSRTKAVIGRNVQNCHPPQSLDIVNKILTSFKNGLKDSYDFWINSRGTMVYIKFLALRDSNRHYLGTIEIAQDIGPLKQLQGEKRLISEGESSEKK